MAKVDGARLSEKQKHARTVPPRVTDKAAARRSLTAAANRISARTAIDFVRTVRR